MIERERPRTPGKGAGGGGASAATEETAALMNLNPAAVLKTLPNATTAAYWLRRSAREEANGNADEALSLIEQGIKRHAEPNEELVAARDALTAGSPSCASPSTVPSRTFEPP